MARMSSTKIERTHGDKATKIMEASFCRPYGKASLNAPYGVVLSGSSLILNFTDGERVYRLILDGAGEVDAVRNVFTQALSTAT